jgi:hypothetical protein
MLYEVLELRGGWADVVHHVFKAQLQERAAAAAAAAEEHQLSNIGLMWFTMHSRHSCKRGLH